MKSKYITMISLFCAVLCLLSPHKIFGTLNYEAYLESWDPNYVATISGLPVGPAGQGAYAGVVVDIAFAELDASASPYFRGLGFSSDFATAQAAVLNVASIVQGKGGKVKISFGGQNNTNDNKTYWFQATSGFPNNAVSLANSLANIFNTNYSSLDGLDFDIEEQLIVVDGAYPVNNQQFANYLLTFFQTLRQALPNKTISITIPGQAWPATWKTPPVPATYWQLLCQQLFTAGSPYSTVVDYVNIMEYPLTIISGNNYIYSQIIEDINYYILPTTQTAPGINHLGWGIMPSKIQLGLCVASAAPGQTMLPSNMQTLAQAVNSPNVTYPNGFGAQLMGVMIWDLSLDAQPNRANPPVSPLPASYAYSQAVRLGLTQSLPATSVSEQYQRNQSPRAGSLVTHTRNGKPKYITPTAFPDTIYP
ncbi:MAG: glycosyl hydrolase family 18 protein [Chlamydiota bacterium]